MKSSVVVGVIDYSAGNLLSIFNALDACGIKWKRISSEADFSGYSHLILPGVGAFKYGMDQLNLRNFSERIREDVRKGTPFLGVCLGMQLLFEVGHEFGKHKGLGIIKGEVKSLNEICGDLSIPHVGWNDVAASKESSFILDSTLSAYFVHSYYCECLNSKDVVGITEYGRSFCSAVEKENIYGVQFHPEKSHKKGLELLSRFGSL